MSATQSYVEANKAFQTSRGPGEQLPMPPSKKIAIVTCMDARIIPAEAFGVKEGEAHVIRNAGGRASDALRSLIISQQLLGTQEIVLIQHTDCGMLTFTTPQARELVTKNLNLSSDGKGATTLNQLDFLDFPKVENNVKADVEFLKSNELIKTEKITGWVYDVKTGALSQIA
ncbi:hypothetical protein CBS101457_002143 [Exobasidium rhododendri]|nr:hypothetical protein CBS101457_002143 [Exobasidium rhododendri]